MKYRVAYVWISAFGKLKLTKHPKRFESDTEPQEHIYALAPTPGNINAMKNRGYRFSNWHVIAER